MYLLGFWHVGLAHLKIPLYQYATEPISYNLKVKYQDGFEPYLITSNRGDQVHMDEKLLDRMGNKIQYDVEYDEMG